jgi:C4-dicarboxylate transporter, DctM subunit
MTPIAIGLLGIAILIVLLFSRIHIGVCMGLVGFLGFAVVVGWDPALGLLKTVPYSTYASQELSVIPMFMLMGAFCFAAGLSTDLYNAVYAWVGPLRGGLAMATVGACAAFAAISGSSLATVATIGAVALPEMKRFNYDEGLATGSIAAGGCIGILIPPSVILLIYGIITEQSIGKLFLAGFLPGVTEALLYMLVIVFLTRRNPALGPKGPSFTFKQKLAALGKTWEVIALFLMVIGGLYLGLFTPTEAAGAGAAGAFLVTLYRRRLTWASMKEALVNTCMTSGMLFIIILGAIIFGYFLSVTRLPAELSSLVSGLAINRYLILIAILVVLMMLGCIMDSMAIVLLTVPIFFPMIQSLGFNAIWFGILVTRVTEMGLITPPVGLNVYVLKGMTSVPLEKIFKGVTPFLAADFLHVALLIAIPQIALFIPNMMK